MQVTKYVYPRPLDRDHVLCVNSLSGAVDVLDRPVWDELERSRRGGSLNLPQEVLGRLQQRGHLFEDAQAEAACRDQLIGAYTHSSMRPIYAVLIMTYGCQLRCPYCFQVVDKSRNTVLQPEQIAGIFDAIEKIRQMHQRQQVVVRIFGGEPLQESIRPALEDALRRTREQGYTFTVTTNGVYIEPFFDLLESYRESLHSIQITLDGPQSIHDQRRIFANGQGSFDRVAKNIEATLDRGFFLTLRLNVDRDNIDTLPELGRMMRERGWFWRNNLNFALILVDDYHQGGSTGKRLAVHEAVTRLVKLQRQYPEEMENFVECYNNRSLEHLSSVIGLRRGAISFPFHRYCHVGTFFAFDTNNAIAACPEAAGSGYTIGSYYPEFRIDTELERLWHDRLVYSLPGCSDCPIAGLCGGGCAFAAQSMRGDLVSRFCDGARQGMGLFIDHFQFEILERYHKILSGQEKPFEFLMWQPSAQIRSSETAPISTPSVVPLNADNALWTQVASQSNGYTLLEPNRTLVSFLKNIGTRPSSKLVVAEGHTA